MQHCSMHQKRGSAMWVKICGNTRLLDCLLAAEAGADAVGFIFAEGRRNVTANQVAAITWKLPDTVEKIGVFTSTDSRSITETSTTAGLTGIQLHGTYSPTLIREIRERLGAGNPVRVLQVVHWDLDIPSETQARAFTHIVTSISEDRLADSLLVDSRTAQKSGGTGRTFDWAAARSFLKQVSVPVIVAGGLQPENITAALQALQPWGLDVSSGVEDSPGVKNAEALRRFIETAKA